MSLQFHSLCIPVKGFLRTAIYDLQFGRFYFAGNEIWDAIKKENNRHPLQDSGLAGDVLMLQPEKQVLPFSKPEFDYPSSITNAIIEIGNTTDFNKLTDELQKNFCYNIQIVASNPG